MTGLFRRIVDNDGRVLPAAWRHHLETLTHVGTCVRCGQPLRALVSYRIGQVEWFPAECTAAGCEYETAGRGPGPK